MNSQLDAAFNYNDLNGLNVLKQGARKDDPAALKAVAQQFESMYIGLIMKSMRDATDVLASDLEDSYQTKFYREMHDQQLALSLSQSGGFGLAEVLYEQMMRGVSDERENFFDIDVKPMDEYNRPILNAPKLSFEDLTAARFAAKAPSDISDPTDSALQVAQADKTSVFDSPREFIDALMPIAVSAAKEIGVEPKIIVAQAALETGWGRFLIKDEQGNSANNLFGIKADSRWNGAAASTTTHEYIDGRAITVKEPFRVYESFEESFNDYVQFLKSNQRYEHALANTSDSEAYVQQLQQAGYATDPHYASKILRIANSEWFADSELRG